MFPVQTSVWSSSNVVYFYVFTKNQRNTRSTTKKHCTNIIVLWRLVAMQKSLGQWEKYPSFKKFYEFWHVSEKCINIFRICESIVLC